MCKNNDRITIRPLLFAAILLSLSLGIRSTALAQRDTSWHARLIRFSSAHTAFPEEARSAGHTYDSQFFDRASHYADSSVLLLPGAVLKNSKRVNLVFWFHGWHNNIDTAIAYYHLATQFRAAHPDAVLVLAETAKDAPDSYGGKLEQPGVFAGLVTDVLEKLKTEHVIPANCGPGEIILAGHSGAYRVIAGILQHGGLPVQDVMLFDALYGQADVFRDWMLQDSLHRFINWHTDSGGGTDKVSVQLMDELNGLHVPFVFVQEASLNLHILKQHAVVFVHTSHAHNDIIFNPDNFRLLLESVHWPGHQ